MKTLADDARGSADLGSCLRALVGLSLDLELLRGLLNALEIPSHHSADLTDLMMR